jgi:lipid-A-disaccharide synthase-like uncharacterized protein
MDIAIVEVFDVVVTPWKLIGYLGVLLFAGRWVVQTIATGRRGEPAFPSAFWMMSMAGSGLLLIYFIWGKNDSVGVLSNLFPMAVALYNFGMHRRAATRRELTDSDTRKQYHAFSRNDSVSP